MENIQINYNYFNWGPFLYKTKIKDETVTKILSLCKRDEKKDMRSRLAGHLKEEYELNPDDIMPLLIPYYHSYQQAAMEHHGVVFAKPLKMKSSWVNFMKEGEYNPPHIHSGCLSCVLYLQVPEDIKENSKNHLATSGPPGAINFSYGEGLYQNVNNHYCIPEVGDFYIFPAWLSHTVFPFKSNEERISLSANLEEVDDG